MLLYVEFEDKKITAEVSWPKDEGTISVQITDKRIGKQLPADLLFDLDWNNKVSYTIEDPHNKRLTNLQRVIAKRLQELTGTL